MRHSKRGAGGGTRLGEILRRYMAAHGVETVAAEYVIPAIWPEVVGPWYARHTWVVRVWEGIVEVQCDSAARAQQLQLDSAEIIRRLNQRIGQQYVHQIRPSTAGRPQRRRDPHLSDANLPEIPVPAPAELEQMPLTEKDEQWVRESAAQIPDPVVRSAFEKAARTHLKMRAWKLAHGWAECPVCGELYPPGSACIYCRTR